MKIKSFLKNKKRVLAIGTTLVLIILLLVLGVVITNKNKLYVCQTYVTLY